MKEIRLQDILMILESVVCLPDEGVDHNAVLGEDIAIDSTDMMRIISRLASKYKIKFTTQDILAMDTVGDIVRIVDRNVNGR